MGWGTKKKRRNDVRVIVGGQKDHEKRSFFELKFFFFSPLSTVSKCSFPRPFLCLCVCARFLLRETEKYFFFF